MIDGVGTIERLLRPGHREIWRFERAAAAASATHINMYCTCAVLRTPVVTNAPALTNSETHNNSISLTRAAMNIHIY